MRLNPGKPWYWELLDLALFYVAIELADLHTIRRKERRAAKQLIIETDEHIKDL